MSEASTLRNRRRGWRTKAYPAILILLALAPCLAASKPKEAPKPTNEACLVCHGDSGLTTERNGKPFNLFVHADKFKNSIHGALFTCVDCHADLKTSPHETKPAKVDCATCHAEQQAAYDRSFHAKAIVSGDGKAATCTDCHGSPHELLPASDPNSRVSRLNVPETCGNCHGQKFVMGASGHSTQPFLSYQESVHGRAVASGSDKAAVCTDCHGVHEILSAVDSKSLIFKFNVPATCAKCHRAVKGEFVESIHGQALSRGNGQAPSCTDCHGIHSIKSHLDPNSSVSARNLTEITCARCHEGVRLSEEFGVEGRRSSTYLASYHGLASRLGSQIVANCASCHGVHNILPSSDPRSTIARNNLVRTCGQCHPGVTENFALGKVHVGAPISADIGSVAVRWIRRFYLSMILAVIGGMVLHNFIIWRRKVLLIRDAYPRTVTRMTRSQRWQHLALLLSFITLVITGFALKYPDSWLSMIPGMGERLRGIVHRTAGVLMLGASVYHILYAFLTRDGRKLILDLFPEPKDATDVVAVLRYYLGLGGDKPEFKRFSYAEKAEYWALVWGIIVMAVTGIMLWAKVSLSNLLPRWWLDIATAIHFYEAVLASLAIVVWHFYQVFLDPDSYPMNWAWWDGKVALHHYREEHSLDSETLLAAEAEVNAERPDATDEDARRNSSAQTPPSEEVGSQRDG